MKIIREQKLTARRPRRRRGRRAARRPGPASACADPAPLTLAAPPVGPDPAGRLPGHARPGRAPAARPGRRRHRGGARRVPARPAARARGAALGPSPGEGGRPRSSASRSRDDVDDVVDADVPLGVVVAFGRIIKAARARRRADGEPPLLPAAALAGRGAGGAGDPRRRRRTGVDLMAVEEGLDTGGIYARAEVAIGPDETLGELRDRLVAEGTRLLVDALRAGLGEPAPQVGEPTYADKLDRRGSAARLVRPGDRRPPPGAPRRRVDHARRASGSRSGAPTCPPAGDGPAGAGGRRRRSSWSRCSPRARPGWRRRPGRTAPAGAPATGSARDRHRPRRSPSTPSTASSATAPTPTCSSPAARAAAASRRATGTSSPSSSTAPPACGGPATSSSTASSPATSTSRVRNAAAPRRLPAALPGHAPHAAVGETVEVAPKPARGLVNAVLRRVADAPGRVARRRHPPQLPRLDRRAPRRRPRRRRRARRPRGDEHRAAGHRAGRRLRAGPRLAVGRRGGRARRRASGSPTSAPPRAARPPRWPPPAPPWSPPTSARPGSASSAAERPGRCPCWPPTPRRPPFAAGVASTGCCSTPPARASARCAAGPTPAGASTPTSPSAWPPCSARSSTPPSPLLRPGGTLVYSVCTLTDAETLGDRRPPRDRPHPDLEPIDAAGDALGPPRPRRPPPAAGRRHRRHVRSSGSDADSRSVSVGTRPPVLTPDTDRRRRSGRLTAMALRGEGHHGVGRGGRRAPGRTASGAGLVERTSPQAGYEVVERIVTADGTEAVARRPCRAACDGLRRPRRHDRRDRVRAPGPHPGGHAGRPRARGAGLAEAMRLVSPLGRLCRAVAGTVGAVPGAQHAGSTRGASRPSTPCSTWCPTPSSCWPGQRPH